MHIPIAIVRRGIRRPALSIIRHAKAPPSNRIKPTEMLTSFPFLKPATIKMPAALKRTTEFPPNCWKNFNPTLISKGFANAGDNHSRNESFS